MSIARTIDFYCKELHFVVGGSHLPPNSTEATFCSLFKGEKAAANIYFRLSDVGNFRPSSAWIAMSLDALEGFWKELNGKKVVEVVEEIEDKDWGYRQFSTRDCDGNMLTFFCFLEVEGARDTV